MTSDLSVKLTGGKLNIRVALWLEREAKLLVCQYPDGSVSLPGGRVKFGETSIEALQREILEEIGRKIAKLKWLGIVENFFSLEDNYHELLFVYTGELESVADFEACRSNEEVIFWLPTDELQCLKPSCLQKFAFEKAGERGQHFIQKT